MKEIYNNIMISTTKGGIVVAQQENMYKNGTNKIEMIEQNKRLDDKDGDGISVEKAGADNGHALKTDGKTVPEDASENELMMVRTIGQMRNCIMDYPSSLIIATFFKAFSDGTRLRILQALSVREMCVSDMCTLLEQSQPAVSNHLRVLNHQRIVKMRRSGKNTFYSLDDWHINAIIGMAMEHLSML